MAEKSFDYVGAMTSGDGMMLPDQNPANKQQQAHYDQILSMIRSNGTITRDKYGFAIGKVITPKLTQIDEANHPVESWMSQEQKRQRAVGVDNYTMDEHPELGIVTQNQQVTEHISPEIVVIIPIGTIISSGSSMAYALDIIRKKGPSLTVRICILGLSNIREYTTEGSMLNRINQYATDLPENADDTFIEAVFMKSTDDQSDQDANARPSNGSSDKKVNFVPLDISLEEFLKRELDDKSKRRGQNIATNRSPNKIILMPDDMKVEELREKIIGAPRVPRHNILKLASKFLQSPSFMFEQPK